MTFSGSLPITTAAQPALERLEQRAAAERRRRLDALVIPAAIRLEITLLEADARRETDGEATTRRVLAHVRRCPRTTTAETADAVGTTPNAAGKTLGRLELAGKVTRELGTIPGLRGRRCRWTATPEGEAT